MIALFVGVAAAGGSVVQMDDRPAALPTALADDEGWSLLTRDDVFPAAAWSSADDRAIQRLDSELEAVAPLIHELDGELVIMRRLDAAIRAVTVLRGEADRDLLYAALAWQGFAVHRYFQQDLAADPMAADWRVTVGEARVRPWVEAAALAPSIVPGESHLSEAPEREAFQALHEAIVAQPEATIRATLEPGMSLTVDGLPARDGAAVVPGVHRVAVLLGDRIVHRQIVELAPGASVTVAPGIDPEALESLTTKMSEGEGLILLDPTVQSTLSSLKAPVHLAVGAPSEVMVYRLQGAAAERLAEASAPAPDGSPWSIHGGLGAGLVSDRDWYLENAADGAEDVFATTNAVTPALALRIEREGAVTAGAGVDVVVPLGQYHKLPAGEGDVRGRFYPHLSAGTSWLQATAGYLYPSQIGLGLRPQIPLGGGFELSAQGLYGIGLTRYRVGLPDVTASNVMAGWLVLGWGGGL